jgi:cobalt/nickel transport protein
MTRLLHFVGVLPMALVCFSTANAHFSMLLPDQHSVKKGEKATFIYQWGHPFEHQLFDAPLPPSTFVVTPDAKKVTIDVKKMEIPAGESKTIVGYEFTYKPDQRGDFVFVLEANPIWLEEEREFLQDSVKVVLHVQAQKGWDSIGQLHANQIVPLTRPYGLQAGTVFQAHVLGGLSDSQRDSDELHPAKSLAGALVEIERYNTTPPKELPPDEHITRTAKTDPNGIVTCTLSEPGWWCVAAQVAVSRKKRDDGKEYPVRHRAIHWVYVDNQPAGK